MDFLIESISQVTWQNVVMWLIGGLLIFLAIKKDMEPALLLPIGFGAILVNIPLSNVVNEIAADGTVTAGIIDWMFEVGIEVSEAMPILLFIGIGAMIDFGVRCFQIPSCSCWAVRRSSVYSLSYCLLQ